MFSELISKSHIFVKIKHELVCIADKVWGKSE